MNNEQLELQLPEPRWAVINEESPMFYGAIHGEEFENLWQ